MKLTIKRTSLIKLLSTVSQAILPGSFLPVYQNAFIKADKSGVEVMGVNLDYSIKAKAEAKVVEEGQVTINARRLGGIIGAMSGDQLNIESNDKFGIQVTSEKSKYHINGLDPAELQFLKLPEKAQAFSLEQSTLFDALESVEYAISKDTSRYALLGALVELTESQFRCAGADGRRLAVHSEGNKAKAKAGMKVTIPAKVVASLISILEGDKPVKIEIGADKAVFTTASATIITKLIEAKFPDIDGIIPKEFASKATVKRNDLIIAVNRAKQVTTETRFSVRVSLNNKTATVTAVSPEHGDAHEELACKVEGAAVQFDINPDYFTQAMSAVQGEDVIISYNDGKTTVCVGDGKGVNCYIAPMNV